MRLPCIMAFCILALYSPAAIAQITAGPFLTNISPDGVTVVWETETPATGSVETGTNQFDLVFSESGASTIHRVRLSGLRPDALYAYRCRWSDQVSETYSFKTAPPHGADRIHLAVIGESFGNPDALSRIAEQIAPRQPDLLIHSGGMVSGENDASAWRKELFAPLRSVINRVPFFPAGSLTASSETSQRYFGSAPRYGLYRYGNLALIRLDISLQGDEAQAQRDWLIDALKTNTQTWTIVFLGQPLFSGYPLTDISEAMWAWQPVLQSYGVDLVISAGDRFYHRSLPVGAVQGYPQYGVVHLTTGGGGAPLQRSAPKPFTAFRENRRHFVLIETQGDRMLVRAIDEAGRGFDSFVRDKQGGASPERFFSFEMLELERDLNSWADAGFYNQSSAELHGSESIDTTFQVPLRGELSWSDSGNWTIGPRMNRRMLLSAGEALPLEFTAAYAQRDMVYPLPQLKINLQYDQSREDYRSPIRGFVNSSIHLSPLRVLRTVAIEAPRSARSIVRGGASEPSWKNAAYVDEFYVETSGAAARQGTRVGFLHDSESIFIYAKMLQSPSFVERASIYEGRDSLDLLANEHIRFDIRSNGSVYSFVLCSNGEMWDAKDADVSWSAEWSGAAYPSTDAWEAEIVLPLSAIDYSGALQLGVRRYDALSNEMSSIIPSFGRSPFDPLHLATFSLAQ